MKNKQSIAVVVLGDLDRSPRMINHALQASLVSDGNAFDVTLVGYQGSSMPQAITQRSNIQVQAISTRLVDALKKLPRVLYVLYAVLRIIIQTFQLLNILLFQQRFDYILVQNPPCVPVLHVCALVKLINRCCCFRRRTQIIIDWHNYGFTIMQVNNVNPKLVAMARSYELWFGKFGDWHLTVSQAMKSNLALAKKDGGGSQQGRVGEGRAGRYEQGQSQEQGHQQGHGEATVIGQQLLPDIQTVIQQILLLYSKSNLAAIAPAVGRKPIQVLYDRATSKFKLTSVSEKAELYKRIELKDQVTHNDASPKLAAGRPVLLLSSTSYTPDEDFMILVKALARCDADSSCPPIQMVVTGKGPLKVHFDQVFRERNSIWRKTNIRQAWLEVDDYPKLVGSCDLGISLHYSSSGFDLPMKVVDMFSAQLPCLAIGGYESVRELVKDDGPGKYGMIFNSEEELADQICSVLKDFDSTNELGGTQILRQMRQNLRQFQAKDQTWDAQWKRVMTQNIFGNN